MPRTTTSRLAVGLGIAVPAIGLAAGCPMGNNGTSPSPAPTATPIVANFTNQSTDAYTGAITVNGKPYSGTTTLQVRNPANTANGVRFPAAPGISTDTNGFFEVSSTLVPTASGSSQLIWPATSGATASGQTTNYTDLYVTDPLGNPTVGANAHTPGVTIEVGWALNPAPGVGATVVESSNPVFKFSALTPQGSPVAATSSFQFQVVVESVANSSISWSSGWDAYNLNGFQWNGDQGTATDTPTGSPITAGAARWQVKWRSNSDGTMAFGQSLWIPITLQ